MVPSRRWFALALLPLTLLLVPSTPPSEPYVLVVVPGSVEVTPDAGGPLTPEANSGPHYANFNVKNTRTLTTTYNLACGTTGTANSCEVEPMQVTLASNAMTDVQVSYSTGASGTGQVVLRATGAAADTGYFAVTSLGEGTPGIALVNHNGTNRDQGLCMVTGAGEAAGVGCGNLFVTHGMPAYRTLGRDRSLALYYNSATATGLTLVAARVSQDPLTLLPDSIRAILTVGTAKDSARFVTFGGGAVQQLVLGKGITGLATGRYAMTLEVRNYYDGVPKPASVNDTVLVVNRSSSGYGRGWSLLGVEELISIVGDTTRKIWVAGDGSVRMYTKPTLGSDVFRGAPGDRPDSLIRFDTTIVSTSYKWFRRNLPHGASVLFDQTGAHRATRNRVGAQTRLVWKTVASQPRLDSIVVPPDTGSVRAYRFFWNSSTAVLDSIRDPIGRRLTSVINNGNLVSLTDPDSQVTRFTYSSNLLTKRAYPRRGMKGDSAITTFAYSNGARLTAVAVQTDSLGNLFATTALTPWDEKGLAVAYSNQVGVATTVAGLPSRVDGPISGTGDAADFWVNRFGAPSKITNVGLNTTTTIWYDSVGTPGLTTKVQYPHPTTAGAGGRIVSLKWDAMGRLRETRDSTRHMGADSVPLKVRQWTYSDADAIQSPDSIKDLVAGTWRAMTYSYDSLGLPVLMKDWRNHQTTASYQAAGALKGVILSTVENQVQTYKEVVSDTTDSLVNLAQGFWYDINGNIREVVAPNGARSVFVADAAGRDSAVFNALGLKTEQLYDVMNRVRQTIRTTTAQSLPAKPGGAPPFMGDCVPEVSECGGGSGGGGGGGGGGSLPATLVTNVFNGAVGTDSVLDPRSVVRSYRYNARASVHQEKDDFGQVRRSFHGVAGLLDSTVSRGGDPVRYRYDTYGRLTSRAYSSKTYLSESSPSGGTATSATTVDDDSISYTYNLNGQVLVAKKEGGTYQIIRSYYGDGSLRTKVTLGDVGGRDSLHYTYDQSGALVRLVHSKESGKLDSTLYHRNVSSGDLDSMKVYWGSPVSRVRKFTFQWDALGRRRAITYPQAVGGFTVKYRYDVLGVLRRVVSNGAGMFYYLEKTTAVDQIGQVMARSVACGANGGVTCPDNGNSFFKYDILGMLTVQGHANGSIDSMRYDASGNLTDRRRGVTNPNHRYHVDPLHNRMTHDSTIGGSNPLVVVYNADGARGNEYKTGSPGFFRYYYYDRMGRMSGSINVDGQGMGLHNDPNACRYDQDDQMSVPCENGAPTLTFDGANVVSAWDGADKWHFVHATGLDDPLIGVLRISNGTWKELFWVTDGSGREFLVSDSLGSRSQDYDFDYAWMGWQYAGGTKNAQSFNASRQESPALPGFSFFRNRVYDQNTGRWTQEDPMGIAGGINLYQFNGNNPASLSDPFGLGPCDPPPTAECFQKANRFVKYIIAGTINTPMNPHGALNIGNVTAGHRTDAFTYGIEITGDTKFGARVDKNGNSVVGASGSIEIERPGNILSNGSDGLDITVKKFEINLGTGDFTANGSLSVPGSAWKAKGNAMSGEVSYTGCVLMVCSQGTVNMYDK